MKNRLFFRLALLGIRNNKKVYIPYILSCIGTVMIYFLIHSLSCSENINNLAGGRNLLLGFSLGKFIVAFFSFLFLLYTGSFLFKIRNKEFGLFNILGMDKKGISKVIFFESVIVAGVSLSGGILLGVVLSKFTELCLLHFIRAEINLDFSFSGEAVIYTLLIYTVIFAVLCVRSLFSIRRSTALSLLRSDKKGEKTPKGNVLIGLAGLILLIAAYFISIYIKEPLSAMLLFMLDIMIVIAATYMLFIYGSVVGCRLLKNNKNYYYQKKHFISVSSMSFRMKRNGAGLASICILSTMVLVMISSSVSLYFGADDAINAKFPQCNTIRIYFDNLEGFRESNASMIKDVLEKTVADKTLKQDHTVDFRYAEMHAILNEDKVESSIDNNVSLVTVASNAYDFYFIDEATYNRLSGKAVTLSESEALMTTLKNSVSTQRMNIGGKELHIVGQCDDFPHLGTAFVSAMPSVFLIIKDFSVLENAAKPVSENGSVPFDFIYYYGYDPQIEETASEMISLQKEALADTDYPFLKMVENEPLFYGDCLLEERDDFYSTFGGLFFFGILFSILFIFAAAMIIYYKQISEGYEDAARFEIMKKVGMSDRDIKKSINSQILTVFFSPLLFGGLHLCFAFVPIWKILQLFNLQNLGLVVLVTAASFVIFGLCYTLIYKITAKAYYDIVRAKR